MLIYNNPDRIRINVGANLVERLAQLPTVVGAKDSSGDMTQTGEYIRRTRGTGFKVMAGRDTMVLATLVYGGVGCVATTANIAPALVVKIYDRYLAGDLKGALEAQYELAPLRLAFNLGSWPVVTKDQSLSAQWEHTILVTDEGYEVLTLSASAAVPAAAAAS